WRRSRPSWWERRWRAERASRRPAPRSRPSPPRSIGPSSTTSCAEAHARYPGQEAGVSSIPPTSLERNSAVTADQDVLGDGGRRRWEWRGEGAAGGLMLGGRPG